MADQYGNPTPMSNDGLSDNIAGGLAYITIIPAIIFLVIDPYKSRPFVRFNCFQCLGLAITGFIVGIISVIPFLHWVAIISLLLSLAWLVAMIMAFLGKKLVIPGIGTMAEKYAAGA